MSLRIFIFSALLFLLFTISGAYVIAEELINPLDEIVYIDDEEVPAAVNELPETDGIPAELFFASGGVLTGVGLFLRKRYTANS